MVIAFNLHVSNSRTKPAGLVYHIHQLVESGKTIIHVLNMYVLCCVASYKNADLHTSGSVRPKSSLKKTALEYKLILFNYIPFFNVKYYHSFE